MIDDATIKRVAEESLLPRYPDDSLFAHKMRLFARAIEKLARQEQREEDARICEADYKRMKDTEAAHYRLTSEPFQPDLYGFDMFQLRAFKERADAIRAAGKENEIVS